MVISYRLSVISKLETGNHEIKKTNKQINNSTTNN